MNLTLESSSPMNRPKQFYLVEELIKLSLAQGLPAMDMRVQDLKHHLMDDCWSLQDETITDPITAVIVKKDKEHKRRTKHVRYSEPILLFPDGSIADGYHRLLAHFLEGLETIQYRQFKTWEDIRTAEYHGEL